MVEKGKKRGGSFDRKTETSVGAVPVACEVAPVIVVVAVVCKVAPIVLVAIV
jgi:hypothetical protein